MALFETARAFFSRMAEKITRKGVKIRGYFGLQILKIQITFEKLRILFSRLDVCVLEGQDTYNALNVVLLHDWETVPSYD